MDYFDSLLSDWEDGQSLERKQNKSGFYKLMKERGFDFDDVDVPHDVHFLEVYAK